MSGFKSIMAVKTDGSFRSRADLSSASDKVLLRSEGIEQNNEDILHEYLAGSAGIPGRQRVFKPSAGSIDVDVNYTIKNGTEFVSADVLLALGMGTVTYPSNSNQLTFLDDYAKFGTVGWDKSHHATEIWQAISCCVKSFSLTCNANEHLTATFEMQPWKLEITSTTNTVSVLAALPTDVPDLVLFSDFEFRIGDQSNGLASSDLISISGFTLNVNNNLTDPEQATVVNSGHTDVFYPIQPKRNGFREVTLEITVPRYVADTLFDFWTADTNLQCDILGTQPSSSEEFDILIPNLKINNISAPVAGAEVITQTVTFTCFQRNHSYMTFEDGGGTDDGEVWIELHNDRNAKIGGF